MSLFLTADYKKEYEKDGYSIPSFALRNIQKAKGGEAKEADDEQYDLDTYIRLKKKKTFQSILFEKIDARGLRDSQVYKAALVDRRYFGKFRQGRIPKKNTVLALALAMKLNTEETEELLNAAGYTLSMSRKTDLIVRHCIMNGIFSVIEVNEILLDHKLALLR